MLQYVFWSHLVNCGLLHTEHVDWWLNKGLIYAICCFGSITFRDEKNKQTNNVSTINIDWILSPISLIVFKVVIQWVKVVENYDKMNLMMSMMCCMTLSFDLTQFQSLDINLQRYRTYRCTDKFIGTNCTSHLSIYNNVQNRMVPRDPITLWIQHMTDRK